MHVLYFLYCLFQYLKSPDEFSDIEGDQPGNSSKLKIFSKKYLDMREFFAKILPEITNHLKTLLKDANIEDRVKEQKFPEDVLKPFNEKCKDFINHSCSLSYSAEYIERHHLGQVPGHHLSRAQEAAWGSEES